MENGLTTCDLEKLLLHFLDEKPKKRYVFPLDLLPKFNHDRQYMIINTEASHLPGKHWVSIYFPRDSKAEFFDSLGQCPSSYSHFILNFLIENAPKGFIYNRKRIQKPFSISCGIYCLFFLYFRNRNVSFVKIMSYFKNDFEKNEKKVNFFYKKIKKKNKK